MIAGGLVLLAATLLILAVRLESHAAALERRRGTIRALRRLGAVLQAKPTPPATGVSDALVDVLHLRSCWYEPTRTTVDLPLLRADGTLSPLVQHRTIAGTVLPDVTAIDAPGGGRFILIADPTVGTTPEERLVAAAIVAASTAPSTDATNRPAT